MHVVSLYLTLLNYTLVEYIAMTLVMLRSIMISQLWVGVLLMMVRSTGLFVTHGVPIGVSTASSVYVAVSITLQSSPNAHGQCQRTPGLKESSM